MVKMGVMVAQDSSSKGQGWSELEVYGVRTGVLRGQGWSELEYKKNVGVRTGVLRGQGRSELES